MRIQIGYNIYKFFSPKGEFMDGFQLFRDMLNAGVCPKIDNIDEFCSCSTTRNTKFHKMRWDIRKDDAILNAGTSLSGELTITQFRSPSTTPAIQMTRRKFGYTLRTRTEATQYSGPAGSVKIEIVITADIRTFVCGHRFLGGTRIDGADDCRREKKRIGTFNNFCRFRTTFLTTTTYYYRQWNLTLTLVGWHGCHWLHATTPVSH